jgi:hypothetical protein
VLIFELFLFHVAIVGMKSRIPPRGKMACVSLAAYELKLWLVAMMFMVLDHYYLWLL